MGKCASLFCTPPVMMQCPVRWRVKDGVLLKMSSESAIAVNQSRRVLIDVPLLSQDYSNVDNLNAERPQHQLSRKCVSISDVQVHTAAAGLILYLLTLCICAYRDQREQYEAKVQAQVTIAAAHQNVVVPENCAATV